MSDQVRFDDQPFVEEVDEHSSQFVFVADHPAGGRSRATVSVATQHVRQPWARDGARCKAEEVCAHNGGGGTAWVCASLAL